MPGSGNTDLEMSGSGRKGKGALSYFFLPNPTHRGMRKEEEQKGGKKTALYCKIVETCTKLPPHTSPSPQGLSPLPLLYSCAFFLFLLITSPQVAVSLPNQTRDRSRSRFSASASDRGGLVMSDEGPPTTRPCHAGAQSLGSTFLISCGNSWLCRIIEVGER